MSELTYYEKGEGYPIVLLHGFCETKGVWDTMVPYLENNYRVIVPDLTGFGENKELEKPISIDEMAVDVQKLLQKLQISRACLIGHSLGGYVSLAFAEQFPEMVGGLSLFHSSAYPDSEEKKANRMRTIESLGTYGIPSFIRTFIPGLFTSQGKQDCREDINKLIEEGYQTPLNTAIEVTKAMQKRPDRTSVLKKADYPVLIFAGVEDKAAPLSDLQKQAALPKSWMQFYALPNTAHMGMFEQETFCGKALQLFAETVAGSSE